MEIVSATPPYTHMAWVQVEWSAYNSSNGETRPVWCDVDGDYKDEIVIGLSSHPADGGWLEIKDDADTEYAHLAWTRVNWSDYNSANGETFPVCKDLDWDGKDEIMIGLGADGQGWLEIKDDADAGFAHVDWLQVNWGGYNSANGLEIVVRSSKRSSCSAFGYTGGVR